MLADTSRFLSGLTDYAGVVIREVADPVADQIAAARRPGAPGGRGGGRPRQRGGRQARAGAHRRADRSPAGRGLGPAGRPLRGRDRSARRSWWRPPMTRWSTGWCRRPPWPCGARASRSDGRPAGVRRRGVPDGGRLRCGRHHPPGAGRAGAAVRAGDVDPGHPGPGAVGVDRGRARPPTAGRLLDRGGPLRGRRASGPGRSASWAPPECTTSRPSPRWRWSASGWARH